MLLSIVLVIVGFVLLIKGADFLVDGASNVAKKFHIPEIVIGLTIVSIGTSMPELFVSISSAINGYPDMAIGNVIGSSIANLLFILGPLAIIRPIHFKRETRLIEIPLCLVISVIFIIICNIGQNVTRVDGIILILVFLMPFFLILFCLYSIRFCSIPVGPPAPPIRARTRLWYEQSVFYLGTSTMTYASTLSSSLISLNFSNTRPHS